MKTWISLAAATALMGILTGCNSNDNNTASTAGASIAVESFSEVSAPVTDADKMAIKTSDSVTYAKGETDDLFYTQLMKARDINNGETFGLIKDYTDQPINYTDGSPYICDGANGNARGSGLDHSSILQMDGRIFMVAQFECAVGAMYGFELEQDSTTGELSVKENSMQYISQKDDFGGWVHCAGMTTPWNSHLGSEEYEPNARSLTMDPVTKLTGDKNFDEVTKYYWKDENNANEMHNNNPYYYGYIPEVKVDASNAKPTYTYTKHFSMGRAAWEMGYVMPDEKTVYLSDDGTNVGFYMYIADKAQDLSAGTLYAAKWNQTANTSKGGEANITWIKLGNATDAEIKAIVSTQPKFSDIFNTSDYNTTANPETGCAAGFTHTFTAAGDECLNVVAGQEKAAAFMETRRYAALLGATTEFRKEEGITFNPDDNKLYVAMSQVSKGMSDTKGDVQLSQNSCGAVYALDVHGSVNDTTGNAINSSMVVVNMTGIIAGTPKTYDASSPYVAYTCDVDGISNPDNVTYLQGSNILAIGEDTDGHPNDFVWAMNTQTGELTRIVSTPYGSETTSPYWYKDINGFGYMTLTTQHPFGETDVADPDYALSTDITAEKDSSIGVVGPFDFIEGDGKGLR
ncbi:DUF839 domain-containing protein [Sulfurovum sp. zt1-1]|uniref:DUF839 domain-containing protein n=1 Tax=Sulfurovum zhangzhouensis TaxID=3019067 RepID=A0ABT7QZM6_9BACT|nr:alkaline phosphatase PhoX [Sulfurovum zhangzhouensis]MDM5271686.1 DUF839 domain-containing protein [Sulfurovum zhangzhouensis]